jgi:hypothetical protein
MASTYWITSFGKSDYEFSERLTLVAFLKPEIQGLLHDNDIILLYLRGEGFLGYCRTIADDIVPPVMLNKKMGLNTVLKKLKSTSKFSYTTQKFYHKFLKDEDIEYLPFDLGKSIWQILVTQKRDEIIKVVYQKTVGCIPIMIIPKSGVSMDINFKKFVKMLLSGTAEIVNNNDRELTPALFGAEVEYRLVLSKSSYYKKALKSYHKIKEMNPSEFRKLIIIYHNKIPKDTYHDTYLIVWNVLDC